MAAPPTSIYYERREEEERWGRRGEGKGLERGEKGEKQSVQDSIFFPSGSRNGKESEISPLDRNPAAIIDHDLSGMNWD